ncbi:hypothetical protein [Salininema proteolyticum]|uniref:Major capsid protein n=1 Tax=Salininema proteolyticum TaxID=1607685 RepID=A0ABV8TUF4_9ACTN
MPTQPHQIVKPEKLAQAAAVLLEQSLVVPNVFNKQGVEEFKGAKNDSINIRVPGILPYRTYGWRNDRSEPVKFDELHERVLTVAFGDDIYSAVKLTDEQSDFDLIQWTKLLDRQVDAIRRGLEVKAIDYATAAPYSITLGVDSSKLREGLVQARALMRQLHTPDGRKTLLVGVDWETALLTDEKLNLAQNVGDAEAVSALRTATIGARFGFNIVVAPELPPNMAIALVDSAFVFATGAPYIPQSVPFGASASHNGVSLRWLRDYDSAYLQDRSIVNTYQGYRHVSDVLVGIDQDNRQGYVGEHEHFVRAIKLVLDGDSSLPDPNGGRPDEGFSPEQDAELAAITGIKAGEPASESGGASDATSGRARRRSSTS